LLFLDVVSEKDAVQVVPFVPGVSGLGVLENLVLCLQCPVPIFLEYRSLKAEGDLKWPVDKAPELGDGQAALQPTFLWVFMLGAQHGGGGFDDLGVDENLGVLVIVENEEKKAGVQADLSSGQTDTLRILGGEE